MWNDFNNNDGYREQACVQLQYGGQPTCYQYTFPGNNSTEEFTFTDLPASQAWTAAETGSSCSSDNQLPAEYIQLDWIQSTGTQWIDTGIVPSDSNGFEIDFIPYGLNASPVQSIFSAVTTITENGTDNTYALQLAMHGQN
ncbi:MAG: hypothetical protein IJI14_14325 [Anaerolineaceae bacterium]|nr:hypothetical protein [Anaerolineaceae bacterium]